MLAVWYPTTCMHTADSGVSTGTLLIMILFFCWGYWACLGQRRSKRMRAHFDQVNNALDGYSELDASRAIAASRATQHQHAFLLDQDAQSPQGCGRTAYLWN